MVLPGGHTLVKSQCCGNVVKVHNFYNVVTTLSYKVVGTLLHNVVVYVVATLLVCIFGNVAKSQRCTTLYRRCVFAGRQLIWLLKYFMKSTYL